MRWRATVIAVACGCYHPRPEIACTVSCDMPGAPCANGLTCGNDRLCFDETPCSQLDASVDAAHCPPSASDLDGDCIPDTHDPCIAPESDALGDLDADGLLNGMDPCPWDDQRLTPGDSDGDGIPDVCDPSPQPDRVRCVMAFTSPALSSALWTRFGSDSVWTFSVGHAMAPGGVNQATMLAPYSLEGTDATTYDLVAHVPAGTGLLDVWLRAGGQSDLGCEIDTTQAVLRLIGSSAAQSPFTIDTGIPATLRIRASISVVAPTSVTCTLTVEQVTSDLVQVLHDEMLPDGTFGISTTMPVTLDGIVIYERR
jgi:hypothetical protein